MLSIFKKVQEALKFQFVFVIAKKIFLCDFFKILLGLCEIRKHVVTVIHVWAHTENNHSFFSEWLESLIEIK